tara:strand:+ start:3975 stop:4157 length:183 start_codon:yes stop_codon:yes gene_type:complete
MKREIIATTSSIVIAAFFYLITAIIVGIFAEGATYNHPIPLIVGGVSFLVVWYISHLDMR